MLATAELKASQANNLRMGSQSEHTTEEEEEALKDVTLVGEVLLMGMALAMIVEVALKELGGL